MKILVTGINGFAGKYLYRELKDTGEIFGTIVEGEFTEPASKILWVDLLDRKQVFETVASVRPDHIYHLAGQANVGLSWKNPSLTNQINVSGTLNLLDAVREQGIPSRVLIIGSADEYGAVAPQACPIREDYPLNPSSPYAISKYAQELYARLYCERFGMDIVFARSFNHIGAGQAKGFVVADFASEIAGLERRGGGEIHVGNLDAQRDFSNVKDIVAGYRLLMEKGTSGQVYNIGSGTPISIRELLQIMLSLSSAPIREVVDPQKLRPSDAPVICCDRTKITGLGYRPKYEIRQTLEWVLDYWRSLPV